MQNSISNGTDMNISAMHYDQSSIYGNNTSNSVPNIYQNYSYIGPYRNYVTPMMPHLYQQNFQASQPQEHWKNDAQTNSYIPSSTQHQFKEASNNNEAKEIDLDLPTEDSDLQINKFENKDLSSHGSPVTGSDLDDDELIITLGKKYKNDWKRVSKKIYKLKGKKMGPTKLRDHFKSLTKGTLPKRVKFTHDEDLLIAKYFDLYGCDWEKISAHFSNRTPMMIKNRYYSYIRKRSLQEDLLKEATRVSNKASAQKESAQEVQIAIPQIPQDQQIYNVPPEDSYFSDIACKRITSVEISLAFQEFAPEEQLQTRISDNCFPEDSFTGLDFISYGNAPYMSRELKSISLEPNFVWNFQL